MKCILSLVFIFFLLSKSFAQELVAQLPFTVKKPNWISSNWLHFDRTSGAYYLNFTDKDSASFFILDEHFEIKDRFAVKNDESPSNEKSIQALYSKKNDPIGTTRIDKDSYLSALVYPKSDIIHFVKINFSNRQVSSLAEWYPEKKEFYIDSYTIDDVFYWITGSKEQPQSLSLYSCKKDGKIEKVVTVELYQSGSELKGLDLANGVMIITEDKYCNLISLSKKIKIYPSNDKLVITSDLVANHTKVIFVDLISKELTNKLIFQTSFNDANNFTHSASFKIGTYLVQSNVCDGVYNLSVFDFEKNNIKTKYSIKSDSGLKLANSAVMQYGTYMFGSEDGKELRKASQFIRKVNNEGMFVYCERINGVLEMTLGSSMIHKDYGGTGGFFPGVPGMSVSSPYGPTRVSGGPGWSASSYRKYTKTILFKTLLSAESCTHLTDQKASERIEEKIENAITTAQNKTTLEKTVKHNSGYLLGYYNTWDKVFRFVKL